MHQNFIFKCVFLIIAMSFAIMPDDAMARKRKSQTVYDITQLPNYSSLVVNADTGDVLHRKDADKPRYPASLTKMMTLYITFQQLEGGVLNMNDYLSVSHQAAAQPRTRLGLKPGEEIAVKDAVMALIIHSANDAAVVLAEAISGSEDAFANRMTETAQLLGMHNTVFKNASGLPDAEQMTTAYDLAKLSIALRRDYPKYYPLFSKTSLIYKGRVIASHNRVLARYQYADGLKTGFTSASGFNLASSASRPEGKIVAIVLGGPSASLRDNHMISLLDKGFSRLIASHSSSKRISPAAQDITYKEDVFAVADNNVSVFNKVENAIYQQPNLTKKPVLKAKIKAKSILAKKPAKTKFYAGGKKVRLQKKKRSTQA